MDWAKAKTILIAVFLAVNIFLAYMIVGANTSSIGYVDSQKVKQITDYLAEKNIKVEGKVPLKKTDMTPITVKYRLFDKDEISKTVFAQGEKVSESFEDSAVKLRGNSLEITIKNNRELYYTNDSIKPAGNIDEKACKRNIEELISKLGLEDSSSIRRVEDIEGYKKYVYEQSFKGTTVYNSMMEFYVNDAGVQRARIVWFDTLKQAGKKAGVISPEIALLYLPEHYKDSIVPGIDVLDIQQGYYLGTGANGQVDASKVEEGTAFPVWRIITDRDIIYVNAHNEKVEGVEKARK